MAGAYVSISGGSKVDLTVYGKGTVVAGNGSDKLAITGKGLLIVGAGADTLSLYQGGKISQTGSAGRDTINIGLGKTIIHEAGHATVTGPYGSGAFGSATIFGGTLKVVDSATGGPLKEAALSGQATLIGSNAATEFIGGSGSTSMVGGQGADTFVGGSNFDVMTGGKGADVFEFSGGGLHLVTDFVSGEDQLYVEGHSLSYLENQGDVHSAQGNTYISLDGGKTTIELEGIAHLKGSDITTDKH